MPASASDPDAAQPVEAFDLPHGPLPARSDHGLSSRGDSRDPERVWRTAPASERSSPETEDMDWEERSGVAEESEPVSDHKEVGSIVGENAAGFDPERGDDVDSAGETEIDQHEPEIDQHEPGGGEPEASRSPASSSDEEMAERAVDKDLADDLVVDDNGDDDLDDNVVVDNDLTDQPSSEMSSDLEPATPADDADDDVHFGVAANALGVSRKTIERLVKRGQLERGPSGMPATVSKRGLVALLGRRRGNGGPSANPAAVDRGERPAAGGITAPWPVEATVELQNFLRPLLEPWIEELVSSRTRSAILEIEVDRLTARSARGRARDELLLALATGNWRQRRTARRYALRHFVREHDQLDPRS